MEPERFLIQIDDLVRPMTDEEQAAHIAMIAALPKMPLDPSNENEQP